jgi:hypothetical protein
MLSHELENPSVSLKSGLPRWSFTKQVCRFAAMLYSPDGHKLIDRVWGETMAELHFAGVRDILERMRV